MGITLKEFESCWARHTNSVKENFMIKVNNSINGTELYDYTNAQNPEYAELCGFLRKEIENSLTDATSKLYHGSPVWFIDEIPVVGYNATAKDVNLLFWSGQSFQEQSLIAAGKFKAAQIKYRKINEINIEELQRWLSKSKEIIWNYKELPKLKELIIYKNNIF